jgi:hypothetical protein
LPTYFWVNHFGECACSSYERYYDCYSTLAHICLLPKYTVKLNYLGKSLPLYFFLCHKYIWKLLNFPQSVEAATCHVIFGHVLLYKIMYICMLYLIFAIDGFSLVFLCSPQPQWYRCSIFYFSLSQSYVGAFPYFPAYCKTSWKYIE